MKRTPVKFSLSGRDDDSNRFLPSWGNIPNTHPGNLIRGHLRLPLVQLRSKSWVQSAPHLQRYYQSARKLGTLTRPWADANGSPHILTASKVCTFTYWVPTWIKLLGFMFGMTYPASYVRGMRSTWQDDLQRLVLKRHKRNHYNTTYKTPPGLHLFHITRLCSTIAQYSQPWSSYHL